jgi:hypothetical protein
MKEPNTLDKIRFFIEDFHIGKLFCKHRNIMLYTEAKNLHNTYCGYAGYCEQCNETFWITAK